MCGTCLNTDVFTESNRQHLHSILHCIININNNIIFCIAQTPTVRPRAYYIVIISWVIWSSMYDWRGTFSVLDEKQLLILFFSVQSAVGSTLAVQQWKMLDPPFSGSSVSRHSLCIYCISALFHYRFSVHACVWLYCIINSFLLCLLHLMRHKLHTVVCASVGALQTLDITVRCGWSIEFPAFIFKRAVLHTQQRHRGQKQQQLPI